MVFDIETLSPTVIPLWPLLQLPAGIPLYSNYTSSRYFLVLRTAPNMHSVSERKQSVTSAPMDLYMRMRRP